MNYNLRFNKEGISCKLRNKRIAVFTNEDKDILVKTKRLGDPSCEPKIVENKIVVTRHSFAHIISMYMEITNSNSLCLDEDKYAK